MKKLKTILIVICVLLLIASPVLILAAAMLIIPPQYSNTFMGALDEKYERLTSIDEPKIVVVGGSSVAFGLESELIEKYMDMPVVNFGLYADLGTKVMLDYSEGAIGEGDIVILAPELDRQTMSMFFNAKTTLEASDDKPEMLFSVKGEDIFAILGAMWEFIGEKFGYFLNGAPDPSGVYNSKSFNEYGDIEYKREKNIMTLKYDSTTEINLTSEILDTEFIDYVNKYVRSCERRGAKVYFSYCPMNEMALKSGTTRDSVLLFEEELSDKLDCPIISNVEDYILGAGYFYDTNFHCNDVGSEYRTLRLIEDLLLAETKSVLVSEPYPEEPEIIEETIVVPTPDKDTASGGEDGDKPDATPGDDDGTETPETPALDPELVENTEYFIYEVQASGNLKITGLTELGKKQAELTVPAYAKLNGDTSRRAVTMLGSGVFVGSNIEILNVPKDSYLSVMQNGCFEGADNLVRLNIYYPYAEDLNPPKNFKGAGVGFEIHAPVDSEYKTDYYWHQVTGVEIILDLVME